MFDENLQNSFVKMDLIFGVLILLSVKVLKLNDACFHAVFQARNLNVP